MLYKFKSPATANLIMLEPNGRQILTILGKNDPITLVEGILLPDDMPAAVHALEAAIKQEEADWQQRLAQAQAKGETLPQREGVSLHQRAVPFIEMIQRCYRAQKEIVWGQ